FPAVNHDLPAFAVDGGDHLFDADGVGQPLREIQIRLAVFEKGRARDDLLRAGREYVPGALGRANAAADAAGERRRNLFDDRQVVAAAHRRVEIDHLNFLKPGEPSHPFEDVIVPDREPITLDELNDRAV